MVSDVGPGPGKLGAGIGIRKYLKLLFAAVVVVVFLLLMLQQQTRRDKNSCFVSAVNIISRKLLLEELETFLKKASDETTK